MNNLKEETAKELIKSIKELTDSIDSLKRNLKSELSLDFMSKSAIEDLASAIKRLNLNL